MFLFLFGALYLFFCRVFFFLSRFIFIFGSCVEQKTHRAHRDRREGSDGEFAFRVDAMRSLNDENCNGTEVLNEKMGYMFVYYVMFE